jgi:hypothetical protein
MVIASATFLGLLSTNPMMEHIFYFTPPVKRLSQALFAYQDKQQLDWNRKAKEAQKVLGFSQSPKDTGGNEGSPGMFSLIYFTLTSKFPPVKL